MKDTKSGKGKSSLLSGGRKTASVKVKNKKGMSKSSAAWLQRQLNDPYVHQSKIDGYRGRAAYKLIEMNENFKLIKPSDIVVDLGAAPGSWCQYTTKIIGNKGKIIGLDILEIDPISNCEFIVGDFTEDQALEDLDKLVAGRKIDVVLSDMAPNTCGHPKTDHIRIMYMLEIALDFAINNLKENGNFVAKVFRGGTEKNLLDIAQKHFKKVKHFKPKASRSDSSEMYLVAQGFRK